MSLSVIQAGNYVNLFLSRRRQTLTERPVAVFAIGPLRDPYDEEEWQDLCAQLDRELAEFPWLTSDALEMLGGKYDPAKLRCPMGFLAGKEPASDLRNWTAIHAWASNPTQKLELALP